MQRRQVLALLATTAGGFAGCFGNGTADADPDSDRTTATPPPSPSSTPSPTPPVSTGDLAGSFDPSGTAAYVPVGSREGVEDAFGPHDVRIWNAGGDQRTVRVRVRDTLAGTPAHEAAHTIPADEALQVDLREPSRYVVELWGPTIVTTTLRVPCRLFDCNESSTLVAVRSTGDVDSSVLSTMAGCSGGQPPKCDAADD